MNTFDIILSEGLLGKALKRRLWQAAVFGGLRAPRVCPEFVIAGDELIWRAGDGLASSLAAGPGIGDHYRNADRIRFWVCGGKVGGMFSNAGANYEYLRDNLLYQLAALQLIQTVVESERWVPAQFDIVWFGSTCQLPQSPHGLVAASAPDAGYADLHPSNRGYAWAKNTALVTLNEFVTAVNRKAEQCRASGFFFLPTNLLGADDPGLRPENTEHAHAVPGMIARHLDTQKSPERHPGAGNVRRDFSTADYAAACAEKYVADISRSGSRTNVSITAAGHDLVDSNIHLYNLPPEFPGVPLEEVDRMIADALGRDALGFGCYYQEYGGGPRAKPVVVAPDAPHAPLSHRRLDCVIAEMVAAAKKHRAP